ncbi:unnamed protein product [Hermetia illucens]|uniref:Tr-type G domain-containing protein n=1 Tax=Hermetia illucens TaxID=343691 RepID=A0A7R8UHQ1_HERIL|nr:unnamed protein product [Hermetia illucens]
MVKAKKGKKEVVSGDEMDSNVDVKPAAISDDDEGISASQKKGKKDKKKAGGGKKATVDVAESSDEEELAKGVKKLAVSGKQKSKSPASDDDEDAEEKPAKKKGGKKAAPKKSGFELLMAEDDDAEVPEPQPEPEDQDEDDAPKKAAAKNADKGKAAKKGKKSKKKKDDSDEDLDKVLAELEMEYSGVNKPESEAPAAEEQPEPEPEADKKAKKGKKKQQQQEPSEAGDNDAQEDGGDEGEGTVKTAAQKKKEKKERQKREAALAKQKQAAQPKAQKEEPPAAAEEAEVEAPAKEETPVRQASEEAAGDEQGEGADAKKGKKKKDKGKKDKDKDEDEKDKKKSGPSKAMVAAMQERLKKLKEEEERLRREEEEKIQREEELERLRLEKIQQEKDRKEKKKQKELERKARLKAEGKLLTKKQKEDRARAQAMLEALKAQGIDIPDPAERKPRPGTRIRPNKKKDQKDKQDGEDTRTAEEKAQEEQAKAAEAEGKNEGDDVKDAWDATSSEEEEDDSQESNQQSADAKQKEQDDSDSEEESDEEESSDEDEESVEDKRNDDEARRERAMLRIEKRRIESEKNRTLENLRAAVVCVLGHVDTGKTKILDKLRRTHVQDSEAGGITQQIGATNVPIDAVKENTRMVKGTSDFEFKLPGLLIIDTPGHESFSNLRNRGSSLCDIAILVVDIMHGLEPQTIESINLLKAKKTPFVVALNKIDRLYDWETMPRKDVRDILKLQQQNTQLEFQQRTKEVIVQFAEQGLNAALFYDNPDPRSYVSLVPTSAITGEGMGNLLYLIVESCQSMLAKRLMYSDELQATVLEVKAIPGLGTTIDAILINGKLREGETIIVAGTDGPIVTQIRSLLMPQPLKELRVKNAYIEYKEVKAAQGVKIAAKDLEKAIAGINLLVAHKPDEVDICRDEVARELKHALSHIKLNERGVYVQASTLGSLEALLDFLRSSKIPGAWPTIIRVATSNEKFSHKQAKHVEWNTNNEGEMINSAKKKKFCDVEQFMNKNMPF